MNKEKLTTEPAVLDGTKLWDEIFKAIVGVMPEQIFPVIKEVFGKAYPKGTSILILGAETSTFPGSSDRPPSSILMDVALLIADTDYYHFECQMENDREMSFRMFSYDAGFATTHRRKQDKKTGKGVVNFPRSVVIYPEKNDSIPDFLECPVIFPDGSSHIYRVPSSKIQSYSLRQIREKHLDLFIPYTILRLQPKLRKDIKNPLTIDELTAFLEEVILILDEELEDGYINNREYNNYHNLFRYAAYRVLKNHPDFLKEVYRMTESLIKLPSQIMDEMEEKMKEKIAEKEKELAYINTQLADKNNQLAYINIQLADKDNQLADKDNQLADMEAENRRLQELIAQMASGKHML